MCAFWDCDEGIRSNHVVCRAHWDDYSDDMLDECSSCGRLKDAQYPQCLDCKSGKRPKKSKGFFGQLADAVGELLDEDDKPKPKSRPRTSRASTTRKKASPKPKTTTPTPTVSSPSDEVFYAHLLRMKVTTGVRNTTLGRQITCVRENGNISMALVRRPPREGTRSLCGSQRSEPEQKPRRTKNTFKSCHTNRMLGRLLT